VATQPPFTPRISPFTGILSSLHSKKHAVVVTQFWIIPQKSFFFKIKIKKIK
jgi:hypothetical protein